jgi:hypothetical protein
MRTGPRATLLVGRLREPALPLPLWRSSILALVQAASPQQSLFHDADSVGDMCCLARPSPLPWCWFSGRRSSHALLPSALSMERTESVRRFAYARVGAWDRTGRLKLHLTRPGNWRTTIGIFLKLFSLSVVVLYRNMCANELYRTRL